MILTAFGSARFWWSLLTGLYTMLGGMRAVAYNDAVQVIVLDRRLGAADHLWTGQIGRVGRTEAVRFGHVQSLEAADAQGRGRFLGAGAGQKRGGDIIKEAWYFNGNFPGWAWPSARR
jgi:hypothetical protein